VPGELYLGGAGLARGYLHQPEMTRERFIANPFGAGRLYKTGDLARYRPDGSIEFLGRADDQVKLRGFRIELGEIEAVLSQHPAVLETVVVVREDDGQPKQLVAYVVPDGEWPSLIRDLRRHLSNTLPDYMVPAAFVRLDTLPLTPNGKIDRRVLPAPQRIDPETGYVAPQTPIEDLLAAIWSEVLGLAQVGRHDNFFDLGGHSLLATQVISRIRDSFKVALPVRTVFEAASIAELALALETARQIEHPVPMPPPIRAGARDGDVPLSFAQQRLWFLDQMTGPSTAYNLAEAFRLHGLLHVAALEQALNEIVRRHDVCRTRFPSVNGEPVQRIQPNSILPLVVVDLQELASPERGAALNRLVAHEMTQPFDLAQGPLLRVTLYQLGEREQVLLVHMHHIVSDAWSMRVWWRELDSLYRAFMTGTPSPLPALPLQYADFSEWQREWLSGEVLEQQLGYWQQQLAHAPTRLELPTDHPRPSVQSFNGQVERFEIAPATLSQLRALSHGCGTSLFMTLYGALGVLLSRYSGQDDLVIGSPIANRHYQEIEPLIGFFVNTLSLRVDLSGNPAFTELLNRVRQITLEAYTHQDVPFEQLVIELEADRNLSHSPLFQVLFVWQDLPQPVALGEMQLAPLELSNETATFDLTFFLGEAKPEAGGGLRGLVEYNTDLFERTTIARMIGHFQQLLTGIIADPDQSVRQLPLLTEAQQHQLLFEWNDNETHHSPHTHVHHLFEQQSNRAPDAIAVAFDQRQLT
ncbi:MAG: condensation domain-containing protein, partial [Candidatus Tectomicrobia bacterium]|nr:condensation domain-containing protein [Candidatus Tectomicrobia bacterium]